MLLTEALFNKIEHGSIFRVVTTKLQTVHNPMISELTFVCKKGGGNDWAIYAGLSDWSLTKIKEHGDKVTGEAMIKSLCPCDETAFSLYRY